MKKNINIKSSILILLVAVTMMLTSCNDVITENPYKAPEFDLMNEVYKTRIVETEDLIDTSPQKVWIHASVIDNIHITYTSEDSVQRVITEINSYVKEDDIIFICAPSDELSDELRFAQEDLELCMIRYEELKNKYAETKEGYLDMQLALIDIEVAQKELSDVQEKVDAHTVKAKKSGVINSITSTYRDAADEFGNAIRTYEYEYKYETTGYVCELASSDPEMMKSVDNYTAGEIIDLYDAQGFTYKAAINYADIYTYYDRNTRTNITMLVIEADLIIEEGVDYSKITIYSLFHDVKILELYDVILVESNLVNSLNNQYFLYVLDNGMKTIRYVTVGDSVKDGEYYVITGGLTAGDELITEISLE
ncbi:MAG: hypothetical protein WCY62_01895 [Clostridia bacterium]